MVGGLVDLHQAHVLAAGDRDDHALGALHRHAVEQRIGDRLLGGLDRAIVARCLAGAHHRLAHLAHHRADVGEVEVDQAGHDHQVGDAAHALLQHLVRHLERFLEGRVRVGDQEEILVRDDDQRIDMLLQFLDAGIGRLHPAIAFEAERLGDDADGQDAAVARRLGDDRGRTGAGAAAHARGDEAHMRAFERLFDLLHRLFGRGAADLGPAAGAQPCVILRPSWMRRSAGEALSACASVLATMKSTPWTSDAIMFAIALPPAPPTPITLMRGFNSSTCGRMNSIVIDILPGGHDADANY
jgi:hypothetical protein